WRITFATLHAIRFRGRSWVEVTDICPPTFARIVPRGYGSWCFSGSANSAMSALRPHTLAPAPGNCCGCRSTGSDPVASDIALGIAPPFVGADSRDTAPRVASDCADPLLGSLALDDPVPSARPPPVVGESEKIERAV